MELFEEPSKGEQREPVTCGRLLWDLTRGTERTCHMWMFALGSRGTEREPVTCGCLLWDLIRGTERACHMWIFALGSRGTERACHMWMFQGTFRSLVKEPFKEPQGTF